MTPVFFMLILGVIEAGLYMKDYLGTASAVRAGARTASAGGAEAWSDMYTLIDIDKESAALSRGDIEFVVIYKATGLGAGPTDAGGPQGGCRSGYAVQNVCNVYYPSDFTKAVAQAKEIEDQEYAVAHNQARTLDESKMWFGCVTEGVHAGQSPDRFWCPSLRNDARSDNNKQGPDYVGVWMKVHHHWVTKIFGTETTMTEQSVIQIEPRSE